MRSAILAGFFACSAAASPVVMLDGEVVGVPDGIYAPVVDVLDDTGAQLATLTLTDVAVTDGLFEVELDLAAVAEQLAAGVAVTVDVELEGLTAVARLGGVFSARSALHADVALTVGAAEALGSIGPAQLVQRDTVSTAGAVSIAFANVVDLPAGIADGDDAGNIDTLGAGLIVTGGTLRVTSVTTDQLVNGTIATASLIDGSFNSASIAGLGGADVAANTLTSVDFASTAISSTDVAGTATTVFAQNIACSSVEGGITTSSTCTRRTCGSGGRVTCGTSTCQEPSAGSASCNNTSLGKLLFAP